MVLAELVHGSAKPYGGSNLLITANSCLVYSLLRKIRNCTLAHMLSFGLASVKFNNTRCRYLHL